MTLRRLVLVASVAGVLAGLLVAVLGRPAGRTAHPTAASVAPRTSALRTALPGVRLPARGARPLPGAFPVVAGSWARIVARRPDPYGGPDWAVRTFRRPSVRYARRRRWTSARTTTCVQVGRLLHGRFVWIDPRRRRAIAVPVRQTDTTVCQGEGRAAVLGALRMPVGRPGATAPRIAATVFWGMSRRTGTAVDLRTRDGLTRLPDLGRGTRLVVARGPRAIGRATVLADGRRVERGLDNQPYSGPPVTPGRRPKGPVAAVERLRVDAVVADPASDRPQLLATAPGGPGRCWVLVSSLVDGEPVRVASRLGALLPDARWCQQPIELPRGGWQSIGGSTASQSAQPTAERRRMRERRTMRGSSTTVLAFPSDVVEVDIDGPTGVRTVRTVPVGRVRLAVLLTAGDLPTGPYGPFDAARGKTYTGRDAAGREVRVRPGRPALP